MKRRLWTASVTLLLAAFPAVAASASLSDVAPGGWASQAVQTLAARGIIDGYPDGTFKGDRQPTRNEMAALMARAVARVEADGAPKADLEKVGQLIDALKDELDALSVRVANVEETLGVPGARGGALQRFTRPAIASAGTEVPAALVARTRERPANERLTRGDLAVLTARVVARAEADRTSKQDLQRAQRVIDALRDKLDLLSARVTNLEAARGASGARAPQLMSRIRHAVPEIVSGDEHLASAWLRLGASMPGALAGVSFPIFDAQGGGITVAFEAPPPFSATLREANADVDGGSIGSAVFGIAPAAATYVRSGVPPVWSGDLAMRMLDPSDRSLSDAALSALPLRANSLPAGASFTLPAINAALHPSAPFLLSTTPILAGAAVDRASQPEISPALSDSNLGFRVSPIPQVEFSPNNQEWRLNTSVPLRVGSLTLQGNLGLAHLQGIAPGARDVLHDCGGLSAICASASGGGSFEDQLSAGTAFDLRALGRRISLNLGASYGRLHRPDLTAFPYEPYDPATEDQPSLTPGAIAPLSFNPNYVDVSRRALGAGAAVPLTRDLTLNLQYNTQFYTGSNDTLGQSIDERKDSYLGNLTYTIPRTSSSIVFSAKQYRYRDALLPTYNVTQNRADLNFTIKF